jgi:ATPase subunit of ABC transporter with duplicated ATPase domains
MNKEINLLPLGKKAKPQILKLSKALKKLLTVSIVVLLVTTIGLIVAYYVFSNRLESAQTKQQESKQEIKALEQTEQRLFLLKDRLSKIEKIQSEENASEEIGIFEFVIKNFDDKTVFSSADLGEGTARIAVLTPNSIELAKFIKNLIENGDFKEVKMSSLELNYPSGYKVVFMLQR